MPNIPERISLASQTEKVLIEGIITSRWRIRLPSERDLAKELAVSRWTLRAALKSLARQKLVRIRQPRGCEIVVRGKRHSAFPLPWKIGFLAPESLWGVPPFNSLWLSEFNLIVQKMGGSLDYYHSPKWYGSQAHRELAKLVEQNPHSCWVLLLSTRSMQSWFSRRKLSTIVLGSCYEGVSLPSVDTNFTAVGRHAVGAMFARGHRRIAFLAAKRDAYGPAPGVLELERAARSAFFSDPDPEKKFILAYHDSGPAEACRAVDRLLNQPDPPTAVLVAHSASLLSAITRLAQRGTMIPRDLSLVSAQDEPYYRHIVPEVTHYQWSSESFAKGVHRLVQRALDGTLASEYAIRITPRFVPGRTLADVN